MRRNASRTTNRDRPQRPDTRSGIAAGPSYREDCMLDLDLLDERHVSIVQEAIAEDRIGLVVQNMHTFDGPGHVLYGECLPRLTGRDGTEHEDTVFVPALEALGAAPLLSRHMIKLVLDALESDPLSVLGYSLSDDNVSDPANWAHIRDQIAARSQLASRLVLRFYRNSALRRRCLGEYSTFRGKSSGMSGRDRRPGR
ncbi:EAL domain protein (plasmid) [Sinorhizobium meliloti AK83]|nr:EAL domain protein [Sinorhizobium meliloti AK83]SEJ67295.1 EAL domain-containing protein [Sinorhizobium meliloti]